MRYADRGRHLFSGYLTIENADEVCAAIRSALHVDEGTEDAPRLHTWAEVYEYTGWRPSLRLNEPFCQDGRETPGVTTYDRDGYRAVHLSLNSPDWVTSLSTTVENRHGLASAPPTALVRLEITDGYVLIDQLTPAGKGCWWAMTDEGPAS